jgi:thymidine kinase
MHHIELHLGPMFSGKTSHLNQLASRTLAVGHTVELWLPPMSEAGKQNAQKSQDVMRMPKGVVMRYMDSSQLTEAHLQQLHTADAKPIDLVLIDETHFFSPEPLVAFLLTPLEADHPYAKSEFHCFGLNGTYQLSPWPTISQLLPLASKIHHYQANCSRCGHKVKAGFTHLKVKPSTDANLKIEGGSDLYQALCHNCFALLNKG